MATPKYIRVNGKVYQRVEAAEMLPSQKGPYQKVIDLYFGALADVSGEEDFWVLKQAVLKAKQEAEAIEEALPDGLRPKDWSLKQQFVDVASMMLEAEKLFEEAKNALDRRPQLAGFADQKGLDIPADYLE